MLRATEQPDDFGRLAVAADRRHAQHVGQQELGVAVLGVLVEQLFEDGARLGAVAAPEVLALALECQRAFAARAQRGVEGQVAEQVEGVGLGLAGALGQFVEDVLK